MSDADKENQTSTVSGMEVSSSSSSVEKSKKKNGLSYQIPWIEKYRPETLDQMVGNEETLVRLQAIAKDGNLPNLILSGPPGEMIASS